MTKHEIAEIGRLCLLPQTFLIGNLTDNCSCGLLCPCQPTGQLSLLPSAGREMCTFQSVTMLCSRGYGIRRYGYSS